MPPKGGTTNGAIQLMQFPSKPVGPESPFAPRKKCYFRGAKGDSPTSIIARLKLTSGVLKVWQQF